MKKKKIRKRYEKMLSLVSKHFSGAPTAVNNCYVCPDKHYTKTVDADNGVTPALIVCPTCGKTAGSAFYRDIRPELAPTYEWYRPSLKKCFKLTKPELEHIFRGGLLRRKIKIKNNV